MNKIEQIQKVVTDCLNNDNMLATIAILKINQILKEPILPNKTIEDMVEYFRAKGHDDQ